MLPSTSARRSSASASGPAAPPDASSLDGAEFDRLLAPLGPFERRPWLGVAVSGGPDSLALTLLAAAWARQRDGGVLALTVDHGLRPGSASEARTVAGWLATREIPHLILRWRGQNAGAGLQARARDARYRLLTEACRQRGLLHLLLAHHADDQAETVALRDARGSGEDGLAGMPTVREVVGVRLLRPLLGVPKARLVDTLGAGRQPWIDDPSNASLAFTRNRLRASGVDRKALLAVARDAGRRRKTRDLRVAAWLARHARIDPAGFVRLDGAAWAAAPPVVARRALLRALLTVGVSSYPPRETRLARLLGELRTSPRPRTLAGCRVLPGADGLLICREPAALGSAVALQPGGAVTWDERFQLEVGNDVPPNLTCRALADHPGGTRLAQGGTVPAAVRPSLPAFWQGDRLLEVPHLGFRDAARPLPVACHFRPRHPLAAAPFAIFEDASDALLGVDAILS